jgi:glycosyltransferase involved in cell wall biosynthesis
LDDCDLDVRLATSPQDPIMLEADALVLRGMADRATFDTVERSLRRGGKLIVDLDVYSEPPNCHPLRSEYLARRPIPELLVGSAHHVIAGSAALAESLLRQTDRVTVVPSVPRPSSLDALRHVVSREELGIPDDAVVFALGTDISTNLGVRTLAGALCRAADESAGIWFLAFGDGPLPATLPSARTTLVPRTAYWHYVSELATGDVGILPLEETLFDRCRSGITLLEYATLGLAVVTSGWGAATSFLADGAPFEVVTTPEEWHLTVRRLADDDVFREARSAAVRGFATDFAAARRSLQTHRRVVESVLGG